MPKVPYHLDLPEAITSRVVFASPHSGRDYPWSFLRTTVLDDHAIRSSEDAFVDRLFDCAPQFGAPLLRANAPRAFLDLNRAADELDPALIEGVRRGGHNPRVASGLGVVPRVVSNGRAIYRGKLPLSEAERRIAGFWHPYHDQLRALLTQAHAQFGESVLIDCHSMPHEAVDAVARNCARAARDRHRRSLRRFGRAGDRRADRGGLCRGRAVGGAQHAVCRGLCHTGLRRPSRRQHAVQIEIDRSIYMDEVEIRPNANFQAFRRLLRGVVADIASIGHEGKALPLAAE